MLKASKGGLNAFGQSLALALGPYGIAVATVAPGFVDTEMAAERVNGPDGDQVRAQSPFNRVARPEEIAAAVVYLASPGAEWASGTIVDLNGAPYLRPLDPAGRSGTLTGNRRRGPRVPQVHLLSHGHPSRQEDRTE